ncbi:MAG: TolC family protein [Spirochaetales bacterium]|nr:TolC family protein [Spirochaetales bacterium]
MKKTYLVILAFFITFGAFAEVHELTVEQAVELALKSNPTMQGESVNLDTLKRARDFSFNDLLPSLNFQAAVSRSNEASSMVDPLSGGAIDLPQWSSIFNLQLQWLLNPAVFLGIKQNSIAYKGGLLQYEDAAMKVTRDIHKMYNNIYLFEKTLGIFKENLVTAKERYENALISYNNGFLRELDLKQIQAAYESLKPQLIEQENQLEVFLMNFKMLLGIKQSDELKLVHNVKLIEEVPIFDTQSLIDTYLTSRADIQKMETQIEALKVAKEAQLLGQLSPSLSISIGYNPISSIGENIDVDYADRGSFSIGISIPIGNYIFASIPLKAAMDMDDSIRQLEIALISYTMAAEFEIRKLDLELKKIKKSLDAEKFNSSLAEDVYVQTEEAYNDGNRVTYLELEEAQSKYNQARISYLSEQINLLNTIVDLEYALNECITNINCEVSK